MSHVWLDGEFLPEDKATLPAADPGLLHGRGLFETLRAYDGVAFRLADHVDRMRQSAEHFKIAFRPPDLEPVIRKLCERNGAPDASVRVTLLANGGLLVAARKREPVPEEWYVKGAEVMIAPWRRDPRAPLVGHKTLSYFENVLTHEEAVRRGCADALFVGLKGELLEGCVTNIFLVLGGKIVTPRLEQGILPGVTRRVVMEIAKVRERRVLLKELWKADEAFLTNALVEVLPIVPLGPVTRKLMAAYQSVTKTATLKR